MERQDATRFVPVTADVAFEGPLSRVFPLVHDERLPTLEHLLTVVALELGVLVLGEVKLEVLGTDTSVAALLARVLVVSCMLHDLVAVHLGLVVKGEEADGTS